MVLSRFKPSLDSYLDFVNGFKRRVAVRGTWLQVWDVGDPALVVGIPEDIDVVAVLHRSSKLGFFFDAIFQGRAT